MQYVIPEPHVLVVEKRLKCALFPIRQYAQISAASRGGSASCPSTDPREGLARRVLVLRHGDQVYVPKNGIG